MKSFLALDYGSKYYGLARFCSSLDYFPKPYKEGLVDKNFILFLKRIISEEGFTHFVLGIPYGLEGQKTIQAELYLKFYEELKKELSIPIFLQDEGLSSEEAKIYKKKKDYLKNSLHSLSAMIILRDFLLKENFEIIDHNL